MAGNVSGSSRMAKWDNVKALLIFLVIVGHSLYALLGVSDKYRAAYFFIYTFHMPLFMFTSGLFSRKTVETGAGMKQKIVGYVILGYLLKFTLEAVRLLCGAKSGLYMWSETSVPWYLFALAVYLPLTRLLRNLPRGFLLGLAVLFACFVGYDKNVGSTFIASRLFVYYPFFVAGSAWDPKRAEPERNRLLWKAFGALFLVMAAVFVWKNIGWLYNFIDLVKGGKSYPSMSGDMGEGLVRYGFFLRLLYYLTALVMSAAVTLVVPAGENLFTSAGRRTIPIFFFHRPLQNIFYYLGWQELITTGGSPLIYKIIYVGVFSVVFFLVLSSPPASRPFDWFWKQIRKL